MASTSRPMATGTRFGTLQIGIMVLTIATALIHLVRGISMLGGRGGFFATLFILNFIGYSVLLAALYIPRFLAWQRTIRWTLIGYTALTIVLYFFFAGLRFNPVGYADKLIELALIVLLFLEDRAGRVT